MSWEVKMTRVFDIKTMESYPYEERGKNVFYKAKEFKTRIIELPPGGKMPDCEMASYVIFFVVNGVAEVRINQEIVNIKEGQCLIVEPAMLSMKTENGVRIMATQIERQ
jgi:mannose-6-phosphate isomerase-like protein (cupin superfamily)